MTTSTLFKIVLSISLLFVNLYAFRSRSPRTWCRTTSFSSINDKRYSFKTTLFSATGALVSLDRAVIPAKSAFLSTKIFILIAVILVSLRSLFRSDLFSITTKVESDSSLFSILAVMSRALKSIFSKLALSFSELTEKITTLTLWPSFGKQVVYASDWTICRLAQKKQLDGGFYRYKFGLSNPKATLGLDVGQEVQICCMDSMERVLKEYVFPISGEETKGAFEVLLQKSGDITGDRFVRALNSLSFGDELAFKAGRRRLIPQPAVSGADAAHVQDSAEIVYLTVVASSMGVAPSLQLLRGVLPNSELAVEEVEFLWLNEDAKDFACADDITALERSSKGKLVATRVCDPNLYNLEMLESDKILSGISPYEPGRMAALLAPPILIEKLTDLLRKVGYPPESIIAIETA